MDLCECMLFKDPDRANVAARHIACAAQHRQQPTRIRTARMANGELDEQARPNSRRGLRCAVHIDLVQIFRGRTLRKELTHHGTRKGFRVISRGRRATSSFVLGHRFRQQRIGEQTLHVASRDSSADGAEAQFAVIFAKPSRRSAFLRSRIGTMIAETPLSPRGLSGRSGATALPCSPEDRHGPRVPTPEGRSRGQQRQSRYTHAPAIAHHLQGARTLVLRQFTRRATTENHG